MTDQTTALVERNDKTPLAGGGIINPIIPQNIEEVYRLATAFSKSGLAPTSLNTPEKCMVAILAGLEVGFAPFQAIQSFACISGRPVMWGDAIPALLWSKQFKIKEWLEGEGDAMVARCQITRPDNGEVIAGEFSIEDAKTAKLLTKDGPWQTSRKRMLKMRARAFAARDGAADVLKGMYIREEVEDFSELRDVTPGKSDLRARLEANAGERTEGFTVENVLDEIQPVQQEKPRRTRRTKAQIELDERVAKFQETQPFPKIAAAEVVADALQAPLDEAIDSLERLGVEIVDDATDAGSHVENEIEDDGERPTAEASADQEDFTVVSVAQMSDGTTHRMVTDPSGKFPEPTERPTEPAAATEQTEAAAEPASPDGTAAEAGTDGTGEPTSEDGHVDGWRAASDERATVDGLGSVHTIAEVEEGERDEGESQPTSAASPGPVELYRMALANSGDFASVRSIVTEFRKTEAFQQADAAARIDINRSAVERLVRMREGGIDIPTPAESVWLFALWMPLSENEALALAFDALQQCADWDATAEDRQHIIASAVRERLGGLL
jgi:hypothetical protein